MERRGFEASSEVRELVGSSKELALLELWISRALTAASVDEIFLGGRLGQPVASGGRSGNTTAMPLLNDLAAALRDTAVEVVDLTAPLSARTPVLQLPPPFGNTVHFSLSEISRYDDRGPAWYWNDITTGEHTGTHFDAPVHWVTGRDGEDVSQVPPGKLIAPASVLDFSEQATDPDFLLQVDHIKEWEAAYGPLPAGGWLLYRTGWDVRSDDEQQFLNANETGPHTPGVSIECANWLATESPVIGLGVETVGTDAGAAHSFDPPFPCHSALLGAGKYGLTQLRNLDRLPPQGSLIITTPLPIVRGSGSPCRALALVER
jgi:kynurenine formamidase